MRRWHSGALALATAGLLLASVVASVRPVDRAAGAVGADAARYPYFVSITAGTSVCAGTVVAAAWVLTTAECVRDVPPERVYLFLSNGRFIEAALVLVHPLFDGLTVNGHDLALLRVPVDATAGIAPVQVGSPWSAAPDPDTTALRLGIGGVVEGGASHRLRAAPAVITADGEVTGRYRRAYSSVRWIGELMLGAVPVPAPPCLRERGDPLVLERDGRPLLLGIGSFAPADCALPQVYAEMSGSQLAWVASWAPAVIDGWGPCSRDNAPGVPAASYGDHQLRPEEVTEGPYYWSLTCDPAAPADA